MMRSAPVAALIGALACGPAERPPPRAPASPAEVELPAELERVLRDYERASARRDGGARAELIAADIDNDNRW